MILETSWYRELGGSGGASCDEQGMRTDTYVFDSGTSSIAFSKDCRGGVAVDVVEDVCGLVVAFSHWAALDGRDLRDIP